MTTTEISNNSLAGEQGMCYTTTERCEGVAKWEFHVSTFLVLWTCVSL